MTSESEARLRAAIDEVGPDLLRYLRRRVDEHDAADLLGEPLLQAWRRVDDCPADPTRRRMWMFTICSNVLSTHHRSLRRRTRLVAAIRSVPHREQPDAAENHAIRDLVQRLPPAQRELVMLVHWDGMSTAEAAEILAINPSTARSRYAQAKESLRTKLGGTLTSTAAVPTVVAN
jgi:RNA polymerase sigma-70 factor (ECF subfamily)